MGGAARSPGAALLAGRASLRVGAGRLTLALGASAASAASVAFPESGVVALGETSSGAISGGSIGAVADDLGAANAVLVGPGLDDIPETVRMLRSLRPLVGGATTVVLDAYALGALAKLRSFGVPGLILTPNPDEAEVLLGDRLGDLDDAVMAIADRYRAVVTCQGWVAEPGGRLLRVRTGGPGLGTSGSGDALAGAIAGLAARGCEPLQATAWGTYLHMAAGESLSREIATLGFLAGEIVDRLPRELARVEAPL
ncbi:ADP-dependent NAD(P)H-hydrate dehydratase [Diaminobutyricibacter sp. McL0618]|uniref:ADP-dependent NAD(P)H-hydrate dehydratase n=1 Tax=Leifsonia sp. McL0618 TaxID=3415677 RepID=UPI003CF54996